MQSVLILLSGWFIGTYTAEQTREILPFLDPNKPTTGTPNT